MSSEQKDTITEVHVVGQYQETSMVETMAKDNDQEKKKIHATGKFTFRTIPTSTSSTPFQDSFYEFMKNNRSTPKYEKWLEVFADVCFHALHPYVPLSQELSKEKEFKDILAKKKTMTHEENGGLFDKKVSSSSQDDSEEHLSTFVFKQFVLMDLYAIKDPKWFAGA
jgi:hypothetical protein